MSSSKAKEVSARITSVSPAFPRKVPQKDRRVGVACHACICWCNVRFCQNRNTQAIQSATIMPAIVRRDFRLLPAGLRYRELVASGVEASGGVEEGEML